MEMKSTTFRLNPAHSDSAKEETGGKRQRYCTDSDTESVVVELATTVEDLNAAYRLVYERYLVEGYQEPAPGKIRFVAHCCLPESYTFVARFRGEIIATLTLIQDRDFGLPLEREYHREIRALRFQGRRIAEVSCLATREGVDRRVVLELIRTMYLFARYRVGVTDWVIAINPKQCGFYAKGLLFESLGGQRTYSACEGAPAVALITDITDWEERMRQEHGNGLLGRFFSRDGKTAATSRIPSPPGREQLAERLEFAERIMAIRGTDTAIRARIRAAYVNPARVQSTDSAYPKNLPLPTTRFGRYQIA